MLRLASILLVPVVEGAMVPDQNPRFRGAQEIEAEIDDEGETADNFLEKDKKGDHDLDLLKGGDWQIDKAIKDLPKGYSDALKFVKSQATDQGSILPWKVPKDQGVTKKLATDMAAAKAKVAAWDKDMVAGKANPKAHTMFANMEKSLNEEAEQDEKDAEIGDDMADWADVVEDLFEGDKYKELFGEPSTAGR